MAPDTAATTTMLRDSAWMVVLYEAKSQVRCWCGGSSGHPGWLLCAKEEVDRLAV